jgi:para-aminobenzoate synthetase component 1
VEVLDLLAIERHPGLVHLVSRVRGRLSGHVAASPDLWAQVFDATYPPASVSGAPKRAALSVIDRLEPVDRGPYCGVVGWIDSDAGRAELAVGIRTFWWVPSTSGSSGMLRFGTGAGITWGSEARAEWAETELKAHRLVALASGTPVADAGDWRS